MSLYSSIEPSTSNAERFLKNLPLFAGLADSQIATLARAFRRRSFAVGVTIYHQDMPGAMLYLLEQGNIRLFSIGRTGQEVTLHILGPGDVFGELSLIDKQPHSATAITLSHSDVWLVPRQDMDEIMESYPSVMRGMLQLLTQRVRSTTHNVEVMTLEDVMGRLSYQLVDLVERFGQPVEDGIGINLPLTQVNLATLVGATRESVNKALAMLRSQNLVRWEGTYLTVLNVEGLQRLVQERGR